jgi:hypothetical protein
LILRQHCGGRGVTQLHILQAAIFACGSVVVYCVRARKRLMAEDGVDGDEMSCSVCQAVGETWKLCYDARIRGSRIIESCLTPRHRRNIHTVPAHELMDSNFASHYISTIRNCVEIEYMNECQ